MDSDEEFGEDEQGGREGKGGAEGGERGTWRASSRWGDAGAS
jgi:hypothetical protein